jgi:hypothetical protein
MTMVAFFGWLACGLLCAAAFGLLRYIPRTCRFLEREDDNWGHDWPLDEVVLGVIFLTILGPLAWAYLAGILLGAATDRLDQALGKGRWLTTERSSFADPFAGMYHRERESEG